MVAPLALGRHTLPCQLGKHMALCARHALKLHMALMPTALKARAAQPRPLRFSAAKICVFIARQLTA